MEVSTICYAATCAGSVGPTFPVTGSINIGIAGQPDTVFLSNIDLDLRSTPALQVYNT